MTAPTCRSNVPGIAGGFELALRFVLWCQRLQDEPTIAQIIQHWNVHRTTAYRWRNAWRAATGQVGTK